VKTYTICQKGMIVNAHVRKKGERIMRKIFFLIAAICMVVGFSVASVYSAENWALGSSGAGSGPYVWGGKIAKHINSNQNAVRISSQATAGMNENVELVSGGQIHIGMQDSARMEDVYQGKGPFQGHPQKRVRVLFTVMVAPYHLVTREAAGINTVRDLMGKKMNIGLPAQTTRFFNEAFLKVADIKLSDIKVFEMATGQAFTALRDGVIDASGNLFSLGHGRLLELASSIKVRLVSIPDDMLERYMNEVGGLTRLVIPANTYKGQRSAITTFGGCVVLIARDDLPNDLVYTVTKAFWDNLPELNKDRSFKDLRKEQAFIESIKVPYHPGALKYLREAGMIKQ
jgi:TRAP transporter TAXI family solute receptor